MSETIDWITASADAAAAKARPELSPILRALPQGPLVLVSDAAVALGVDPETVRAWIDEGLVRATNFGSKKNKPYWKLHRDSLVAFLSSRTV
ncbi:MAG: helix-turn-helix domain-containing protein [Kiritimatiellae bacterium]|nr:helix-turn-helix domain-containing protein [Kiritimatiellia bacterium]